MSSRCFRAAVSWLQSSVEGPQSLAGCRMDTAHHATAGNKKVRSIMDCGKPDRDDCALNCACCKVSAAAMLPFDDSSAPVKLRCAPCHEAYCWPLTTNVRLLSLRRILEERYSKDTYHKVNYDKVPLGSALCTRVDTARISPPSPTSPRIESSKLLPQG